MSGSGTIRADVSYHDQGGQRHVTRMEGELVIVACSRKVASGSMPEIIVRGEATCIHVSATVAAILGTLEQNCGPEAVATAFQMYHNSLEHLGDL